MRSRNMSHVFKVGYYYFGLNYCVWVIFAANPISMIAGTTLVAQNMAFALS